MCHLVAGKNEIAQRSVYFKSSWGSHIDVLGSSLTASVCVSSHSEFRAVLYGGPRKGLPVSALRGLSGKGPHLPIGSTFNHYKLTFLHCRF